MYTHLYMYLYLHLCMPIHRYSCIYSYTYIFKYIRDLNLLCEDFWEKKRDDIWGKENVWF